MTAAFLDSALQPATDLPPQLPFGAVVARQLSVWPFAARTAQLFVLVDPSLPDQAVRRGLLRAMQQAYFASEGYSQTRAVREAALAAHYVLRHHNRDVLPLDQVNAATAVAALRSDVAFVALAGHAAAFAWRNQHLTGQRGILRLPRPLGLEQDPLITLWSTPLGAGERLVLVCGATWRPESGRVICEILSNTESPQVAERHLSEALGNERPAAVLVIGPDTDAKPVRHLRLVMPSEPVHTLQPAQVRPSKATATPWRRHVRQWLTATCGMLVLAALAAVAFTIAREPARPAASSTEHAFMPLQRVDHVSPSTAVRLGPAAANVIDLAVGDDALYTLDVAEGSVRAFRLDALDQQPTPETMLVRTGMPFDVAGHRLAAPVAIAYLSGSGSAGGVLAVVDQARSVIEIGRDRQISPRSVPSSASWQQLGALGSDAAGDLLFLDSGAGRLLEYPPLSQRVVDPPRVIVDATRVSNLRLESVAEIVGEPDTLVLRLDDGTVHRVDVEGVDLLLLASASDRPVNVSAIASDRAGGLYLADPNNARVLHTTVDGEVLRELRDPTLAGVRQIQTSLDGQRLYGLVASGVLVFAIPAL